MIQILTALNAILFISLSFFLIKEDLKTHRLPNRFVLPLILVNLLHLILKSLFEPESLQWMTSLGIPVFISSAFLLCALLFPSTIGMGDVKVILLIGLLLSHISPTLYLSSLAMSFVSGSVYALIGRFRKTSAQEIVFGPFLLIPAMIFVLVSI